MEFLNKYRVNLVLMDYTKESKIYSIYLFSEGATVEGDKTTTDKTTNKKKQSSLFKNTNATKNCPKCFNEK